MMALKKLKLHLLNIWQKLIPSDSKMRRYYQFFKRLIYQDVNHFSIEFFSDKEVYLNNHLNG